MEAIYTPQEASEILKVEEETIRRWVRQGKLKGSRIGNNKTVRITESAINNFIKDTEV